MGTRRIRWWLALIALGAALPAHAASREDVQARAKAVLGVLPAEATSPDNPITPQKIALGRMLYYDNRLSIDGKVSCNSCHLLGAYGVDNEPTSPGHEGKRGARNSPTVYNAAFQFAEFWDGRAKDVEEQAKGPVLNPVEMGMPDPNYVVKILKGIPGYAPLFRAAFPGEPDPITYDNAARAIGAFERRLVTPSRFDAFLSGQSDALTDAEVAGLSTFLETGCPTCHMTATVGGKMFQKIGLVHPYPTEDLGRYAVTKNEADKYFFKVPSLRNVAKTAPYFHDGSVKTLPEAVRKMAWHQLGKELSDADVQSIVVFLGSLTGNVDQTYIAIPTLP
ncbi:MAG TPA: cytochrome-c peroxidase [Myxococcota bacterium]|nr:cytochrome-c peroxidase [Myxococcota bacterium]